MKNSFDKDLAEYQGDLKKQLLDQKNQQKNQIDFTEKTQGYDFPIFNTSSQQENQHFQLSIQDDISRQIEVYSSSLKNSYDQDNQCNQINSQNRASIENNISNEDRTLTQGEIIQQILQNSKDNKQQQQRNIIPRTKTEGLADNRQQNINQLFYSSDVKQKKNQTSLIGGSDGKQSRQFSIESFLQGKISNINDSKQRIQQINDELIKKMYTYDNNQPTEQEFLKKLYLNSQFLKFIMEDTKKNARKNQEQMNQQILRNSNENNIIQVEVAPSQLEQQFQLQEYQDEQNGERDKLIESATNEKNIQLNQLLSFKDEIKYQFKKIHFNVDIVQIRKKFRKKIFIYIVCATFFQFFVDNLINQIEQVVGQAMYTQEGQPFNYQSLSTNVTLYFAIFNVAFFPLLMGFIIDQIYSSIVMLLCLIVMFIGRILTLYSILMQTYQARVLAQFFYTFGDSGFYLTSIYCIYFYYYDPNNTKKFVLKLTKYLGLGCSLPRNLSAIPIIFIYQASQNLDTSISQQEYNEEVKKYMPFLFDYPQKQIVFSLITALSFLTVFFGLKALKLDKLAHDQMSEKNFNYINNPLFKADIDDIIKNIFKNLKFIGVIFAGGIIYGLTSQNIIFNVNKTIYNQVNGSRSNQPPNMTLFIIVQGHELIYIIFIWYFGKIISKKFFKKYEIWKYSATACLVYYVIQLILTFVSQVSNYNLSFFILVIMFIINIFSGISFSTNVLCVDSILAKNIDRSCIGFAYSIMNVFKKLFELLGDLSLDLHYTKDLPIITVIGSVIGLMIIFYIAMKSKQNEEINQQDIQLDLIE